MVQSGQLSINPSASQFAGETTKSSRDMAGGKQRANGSWLRLFMAPRPALGRAAPANQRICTHNGIAEPRRYGQQRRSIGRRILQLRPVQIEGEKNERQGDVD